MCFLPSGAHARGSLRFRALGARGDIAARCPYHASYRDAPVSSYRVPDFMGFGRMRAGNTELWLRAAEFSKAGQ